MTACNASEKLRLPATSTPDAPVAAIIRLSEVEVSLSTVMQLKVLSFSAPANPEARSLRFSRQ